MKNEPPRVHLIGRQNHGKTALIVELVAALTARGLRVGTVKHTGHSHPVDVPGKDSDRHRKAGASPAAFVTPSDVAVFSSRPNPSAPDDLYGHLSAHFADCDVVLVEGDQTAAVEVPRVVKIEVWRGAAGTPPIAAARDDVQAIISDDEPPVSNPVWPRRDPEEIVNRLLSLIDLRPRI